MNYEEFKEEKRLALINELKEELEENYGVTGIDESKLRYVHRIKVFESPDEFHSFLHEHSEKKMTSTGGAYSDNYSFSHREACFDILFNSTNHAFEQDEEMSKWGVEGTYVIQRRGIHVGALYIYYGAGNEE